MQLIIDIGNTLCKLALFNNNKLIKKDSFEALNIPTLELFLDGQEIHSSILSSVRDESYEWLKKYWDKKVYFIELDNNTNIPITNNYDTPETLGKDRLAAVIGAFSEYPNKNLLVIDAGTAITYDFITEKGIYLGGNIAPGLSMRFRALNEFTGKLPLIQEEQSEYYIGKSTRLAINNGVVKGMEFEVKGYVEEFTKEYGQITTIITGGNADFFVNTLKNFIFVDQNLIVTGLKTILDYNVEQN